jgi:hypothetical protein
MATTTRKWTVQPGIDVGTGYRRLHIGERILPGDEMLPFPYTDQVWRRMPPDYYTEFRVIRETHVPFRRKVEMYPDQVF